MAMLHEYPKDRSVLKREFAKAAAEGKFLLLLRESTNSELMIESCEYTRVVANDKDAFDLLKAAHDEARSWGSAGVVRVFEPGKTYDECWDTKPEDSALGSAVSHFKTYIEKCDLEKRLAKAETALAQPLWKRALGL